MRRTIDEIQAEKEKLLKSYHRLEKEFNELNDRLVGLRKSKDVLEGNLAAGKSDLEEERSSHSKLSRELGEQLQQSEFDSVEEVRRILAQPVDLDNQKMQLSRFRQDLALAESHTRELEKEMADRIYDAGKHQELRREIATLGEQLKQKNQELGKIFESLKKLRRDLEKQALLRQSMEKLELRAGNIKTMKSLFKASGFVNYISSVYLQNLCNAANERFFQLTRQKLSLEITADNNFQVRDYLNGGKVRNVKTLSGGQTFQAALSLALSLADNIQKITESKQNFFFLDEGFGSLDHESLAVVFDTLKSLRKENRIVGVISHVEEMQQEIDIHLRIENNEERGSLICESWKK